MFSKGFTTYLGMLLSLHAAYSAAQHRSYLRITEQEFTLLPTDILVQTLAGLLLILYGVSTTRVKLLKEIRANCESEKKTWENLSYRVNFSISNHRGRVLFST